MRLQRCLLALLPVLTLTLLLPAADPPVPVPLPTETEAAYLALEDAVTLPPLTRLLTRYLWLPEGVDEQAQEASFVLNSLSTGDVPYRPQLLRRGKVAILRVEALAYAPQEVDLKRWLTTWEELRFDPSYNLLITADTANLVNQSLLQREVWEIKDVPPYLGKDGVTTYRKKWVKTTTTAALKAEEVIRQPHPRAGNVVNDLKVLLRSEAPIVDYPYFLQRSCSTIKGKGLFKTLYGGLYYELSGTPRATRKGQTDEDALFESLGVGSKDEPASKVYERVRSDQRIARFKSEVTGKPRRADFLRSLVGRNGEGRIAITHDPADDDVDIGRHPMMNLRDVKDRAREVIYDRRNGLIGGTLYNDQGALQDVVPPDIASDHTIPAPHTRNLEPMISCWRCHASSRGWKPAPNDVKRLLGSYLDVFSADATRSPRSLPDDLARIAGQYGGDVEFKWLPRARDDYAAAVLQATGPWRESKDQLNVVELAIGRVSKTWSRRRYETVNAQRALAEIGWQVNDKDAAPAILSRLCPQAILPTPQQPAPEDPRIAALFLGMEITPVDWDLVKPFVIGRLRSRP